MFFLSHLTKAYASFKTTGLQRLGCSLFVLGLHGLLFAGMLVTSLPAKQNKSVPHTVAAMLLTETVPPPRQQIAPATAAQDLPALTAASTELTPEPEPEPRPVLKPKSSKAEQVNAAPSMPVVLQKQADAPRQKPALQDSVARTDYQPAVTQPSATQASATHPTADVAAALEPTIQCLPPAYPRVSRQQQEQGQVTLRFLIGKDGHVLQTQIASTSGYSRLDEAAREALSKCQFRSAVQFGQAVQSWAVIKYLWRLQ